MKKIVLSFILFFGVFLFYSAAVSAKKPTFVGTEGCKCHKNEVKEWQDSKHGKAFETLLADKRGKGEKKAMKKAKLDPDKDYSKDEKCLKCHTAGYGDIGGFEAIDKTPDLAGVGCEMCHGAGSEYRKIHKEKDVNFTLAEAKEAGEIFPAKDNPCKDCHESKDTPFKPEVDEKYKFNFTEMIKLEKAFHKVYPLQGKR